MIGSGGTFPVSIAVNGNVVYVLNARSGGSLQGLLSSPGGCSRIPGPSSGAGPQPDADAAVHHTPGEVGFTPDGRQLIVTTKGNGSDIDVFAVDRLGVCRPRSSTANRVRCRSASSSSPGRLLQVTEAGTNAVATFSLVPQRDGDAARLGCDRAARDVLGGR